jgi:sugar-specific transcriptional regulator TrmB
MTQEQILEEAGLSKNEAKVYLSLICLGCTTAGQIAKHSKVPRPNVYDALERLQQKGLVSYTVRDEKKHFEVSDPNALMGMIKEKEKMLNKLMPKLMMNQQISAGSEVQIFEGMKAVQNMFYNFLAINQTLYVIGAPKIAIELIGQFLEEFHRKRAEKKMNMTLIYNSDAENRVRYINQNMPYTTARVLSTEFDAPITTHICGDQVVFILWHANPLVIRVKRADLAKAYKGYFDILWSLAK